MRVRELLRSASVEMASHKTRSALTAFSMSIGVAAVLYTLVQVDGIQKRFDKAVELAGPGRLEIKRKQGYVSRGLSPGLTAEDAEEMRRQWPGLFMVYPMDRRWGTRMAFQGFTSDGIMVMGTTHEWSRRDWVYDLRGRFLNDEDVRTAARVCVILQPGGWVKKPFWARYFPEQALEKVMKRKDLVGRHVRLEEHLYKVVGVLREPPRDKDPRWFRMWMSGMAGTVIVPVSAYRRYMLRRGDKDQVDEIQVDTGEERTAGLYLRRIESLLLARHRGEQDVEIKDYRERIQGALQRIRQMAAAILIIGVVAILAGGIGIMNVTLATIFSRVREIGIRRALGATRSDIVWQFVSEAMLLGFLGGAAGTALGVIATTYLVADNLRMGTAGPQHVAYALLIAVGAGFLFSIYPAYQASRFDPVESLRYE